ncbi:MAG TPA: hypothetical protein ACFYEI_06645 [Candidatus Tripitaka californicus]|uniref:hypothetical protein n=1 Tax=Candidatus Tripitaka californicus TaxID=3367616 RepID=UPI0040264DB6
MRLLIPAVTIGLLVSFSPLAFAAHPEGTAGKRQHGQCLHNPPGIQRRYDHPRHQEAKPVWWGKGKGHKHPNRDKREDIRDKREDRRDRREDVRDKREDRRDRLEDIRDKREDVWDAKHDGGKWDKLEDKRDKLEDIREKMSGTAERTGGTVLRTSGTTGTNHPCPQGLPAYSMHLVWNMRPVWSTPLDLRQNNPRPNKPRHIRRGRFQACPYDLNWPFISNP